MRLLPLFLLFVIVLGVAGVLYFRPLSVTGPEGLDVKIVAVQYGGRLIYREVGSVDAFTRIALWDDKAVKFVREPDSDAVRNCHNEPALAEHPEWFYEHDGGSLLFEVSRPELLASFTPPDGWRSVDSSHPDLGEIREVEWVNRLPNGTLVKRVGRVIPAEFIIQIASQDKVGYAGAYRWGGIDVWMELYGVYWEPHDPAPPAGNSSGHWVLVNQPEAFIVPVLTWVKAGTPWVWRDDKGQMVTDYLPDSRMQAWLSFYPDLAGREFTMYYSVDEYYNPYLDISDVLEDNPLKYVAPDRGMVDRVYIHLRIDKYGPFISSDCGSLIWTPTGECCSNPNPALHIYYPASYVKVRTLLLVWGEFHYVWTQEEAGDQGNQWENRTSEDVTVRPGWPDIASWFRDLGEWLQSPAGLLTLVVVAAALLIILGIVLLTVGGRPIIIRR